jgi:aminoglycoside phosphotransferase (APT) family kinase protein
VDPIDRLPEGLAARLRALFPGARVTEVARLGVDEAQLGEAQVEAGGETTKGLGYGQPIRIGLAVGDVRHDLVLHTAKPDDFGHDRRSDRVAEMLLAWDTFRAIPAHVEAVDVGLLGAGGELVSLAGAGEAYLLSRWAEGTPYAVDLRRVARSGIATEEDLRRVEALARLLAAIHAAPGSHTGAYVRAWRDLVGSGEGIAGIADGYGGVGEDVPGAPAGRIAAIEARCLEARHRHRGRVERLRRTHGDFHPFNVLFDARGVPVLLDASRGAEGDPADDVACLAINFLFFGLAHRDRWATGLGLLWHRFFEAYASARDDAGLFEVIAPFFAWRGLVVTSPAWYPHLSAADRDRMLAFVERALDADRFDPAMGVEAMA